MRKSLFFGALALALGGALSAPAAAQRALAPENAAIDRSGLPTLEAGEMRLADRLAADFFENDLRLSQSRRIEAETVNEYLSLSLDARETFRDERRRFLRSLSHEQRLALRNVKTPAYNNLSEDQKERFRRDALSRLAPSPQSGASQSGASPSGPRSGADDQDV